MQQYDQIAGALSQQWKRAYRILLNCTLIIFIRLNWYKSHSTFVVFYFLRIWKFWYRDSLDYIFFFHTKVLGVIGELIFKFTPHSYVPRPEPIFLCDLTFKVIVQYYIYPKEYFFYSIEILVWQMFKHENWFSYYVLTFP